jgi:hypothetical protein
LFNCRIGEELFIEGDWELGKEREEDKEVKRGEGKGRPENSSCQGVAGSVNLKNTMLPQHVHCITAGNG